MLTAITALVIGKSYVYYGINLSNFTASHASISIVCILISLFCLIWFNSIITGTGIKWARLEHYNKNKNIDLRSIFSYFISVCLSLAAGLPLGKEGPSISLGGAWFNYLNLKFFKPHQHLFNIDVVILGCISGLASAFCSPLTAVLFAAEVLFPERKKQILINGWVWLTSILSFVFSELLLKGHYEVFKITVHKFSIDHLIQALLIAVIVGLVSVVVLTIIFKVKKKITHEIHNRKRLILFQVLTIALFLWCWKYNNFIFGSGSGILNILFQGNSLDINIMLITGLQRLLFFLLLYLLSFSGGTFVPIIVLGAILGGIIDHLFHATLLPIFPHLILNHTWIVWITMSCFFAALMHAPFTVAVLVAEMTNDYSLIPFVFISAWISLKIKTYYLEKHFYSD